MMFQRVLTAFLLMALAIPTYGEPAAPPEVDAAIDRLMQLDPAALLARLDALKNEAATKDAEIASLRQQAETLEQQAAALHAKVEALMRHVEALAQALGSAAAPAPPQAMSAETPAGEGMEASAIEAEAPAEAAMEAPVMVAAAPSAEGAQDTPAQAFTNFDEHIKPIFDARCARCHNNDTRKSGLSLANFAAVMEGGSSGAVVAAGNADESRLLRLVMKVEEPYMPPSGEALADAEIALIRKWITEGALPNASAAPMTTKQEAGGASETVFVAAEMVEGPPPMPEVPLSPPSAAGDRGVVARAVDTSPRAPLAAVGADRQVLLYNLETFALLGALPFPEGDIFTLSFSVNGELLVAGGGQEGHSGLAVVWKVRTGERVGVYGQYYDTVMAADISPDHRFIALGGPNKKVRVYAMDGGRELYVLEPHTDWIYAVKFTPDGEVLATADRAGGLFLWQAANGRAVEQLRGHEGAIHALAYTPDSTVLASAGEDGTVQLWDTWKYTRIRSFKAHDRPVLNIDISEDSRILTTSADRTTRIWAMDGAAQHTYEGLGDWGYQARFGRGASLVLAGSWSGDILLWETDSGNLISKLLTNPSAS